MTVHGLFMLDVKICRLLHIFSHLVLFIVCDSLLLDYLSQPLIFSIRYKCTFNRVLRYTIFVLTVCNAFPLYLRGNIVALRSQSAYWSLILEK